MIIEANTVMAHRRYVNMKATNEVLYWTKAFEATPKEVRKAVKDVGSSVSAIRTYLNTPEHAGARA